MIGTRTIYDHLQADVRRWFARRAPDDAVDDLVQETFLRIHRSLPELRDADRVAPWVFRVCRSVLVDRARRQRPEDPMIVEQVDPDSVVEPDATAVVAGWLPAFVETLPDGYREAVRLSELEGVSQREVAERLGLSASGARSRVQRGRKLLRQALDECCRVTLEGGDVVDVRRRTDGDCACRETASG